MFGVIVVVDRNIHGVALVKAEGSTLFGFSENISPHNYSRAILNLKIAIGNFITNEEVATFDVFGVFGAGE
jgi:hypothetical protein